MEKALCAATRKFLTFQQAPSSQPRKEFYGLKVFQLATPKCATLGKSSFELEMLDIQWRQGETLSELCLLSKTRGCWERKAYLITGEAISISQFIRTLYLLSTHLKHPVLFAKHHLIFLNEDHFSLILVPERWRNIPPNSNHILYLFIMGSQT